MKEFFETVFGVYTPVTYTDSFLDSSGDLVEVERIASGLAGVDWTYVLSVVAFLIVLYGVIRIIGGVISRV